MRYALLVSAIALGVTACGAKEAAAPAPEAAETPAAAEADAAPEISAIDAALASSLRSDAEKARDTWRHPKETLAFFGVEPDDKVVEIWPGGGWYANILAPYLAAEGTYVAAGFDVDSVEDEGMKARLTERNEAFKANFADPKFANNEYSAFSSVSGALTEAGTADSVLTFRNVHSWMGGGYADKLFVDAYAALKPGGVLGVVEHRLPSTQTQDPAGSTGYVHEDYVKSLAEAAGFEFVEASEINANPADTADHPYGVWTLPPNSRTSNRDGSVAEGFDAEAALAIGESDRMTLKFRKPE